MVYISTLLDEIFYSDICREKASDAHLALRGKKYVEHRAARNRCVKSLGEFYIPKRIGEAGILYVPEKVLERSRIGLLDIIVKLRFGATAVSTGEK